VKHGDLSTVTMNGNPIWPRVLLDGSQDHDGDGVADASMSCSDPIGTLQTPQPPSPTTATPTAHSCPAQIA
jgi:hypothetical protein